MPAEISSVYFFVNVQRDGFYFNKRLAFRDGSVHTRIHMFGIFGTYAECGVCWQSGKIKRYGDDNHGQKLENNITAVGYGITVYTVV